MPPKILFKIGGGALLLAVVVFSLSSYWLTTRTFEPVNMPVKLEAGRIQSAEFPINLQENYTVGINVDYSLDDWTEGKCSDKLWQETDWKVYRLHSVAPNYKELWASSEEMRKQGLWPHEFHAPHGRYELEWTVPASTVCLNARHPQLRVWTDRSSYETAFSFVLFSCWLFTMAGVGALLRAVVIWLSGAQTGSRTLRIFPEMAVPNLTPLLRHRPLPLVRDFPNFGLIYGFILWVLLFLFMIFQPRPSNGLPVNFKAEHTVIVERNPWAETMAVYIDGQQRFFVNGKQVPREELRSRLEEELLRRGVWVVYFEADVDCLYMNAVYAMDTIQGLGAKMIWITPKTREEWKKRETPKISGIPANRIP